MADSTLSLRRSIYNRILAGPFGKLNLDEIKPVALGELLDRVKREWTYPDLTDTWGLDLDSVI